MTTLPGEAARYKINSGAWYYVVCKKAAFDIINKYFYFDNIVFESFDPNKTFSSSEIEHFEKIYRSERYNITEYTAETVTWKDVTSTKITANLFDARATVQLPEDLTIKEGANKFELLVTAEDKTTTQVYTIIAMKPAKVGNTLINTDMTTVSAKMKVIIRNQKANVTVTDEEVSKILEIVAADNAKQIALVPDFSKWGPAQAEITLSKSLKGGRLPNSSSRK